jgi:hypothetical protein
VFPLTLHSISHTLKSVNDVPEHPLTMFPVYRVRLGPTRSSPGPQSKAALRET